MSGQPKSRKMPRGRLARKVRDTLHHILFSPPFQKVSVKNKLGMILGVFYQSGLVESYDEVEQTFDGNNSLINRFRKLSSIAYGKDSSEKVLCGTMRDTMLSVVNDSTFDDSRKKLMIAGIITFNLPFKILTEEAYAMINKILDESDTTSEEKVVTLVTYLKQLQEVEIVEDQLDGEQVSPTELVEECDLTDEQELWILQGHSGSGKSTFADILKTRMENLYPNRKVEICATDYYFTVNNVYTFDKYKLPEYHLKNFERAQKCMDRGNTVIVDNTNIMRWYCREYVKYAVGKNIKVRFVRLKGEFPSIHKVPKEVIQSMKDKLEELTVGSVLASKTPAELEAEAKVRLQKLGLHA